MLEATGAALYGYALRPSAHGTPRAFIIRVALIGIALTVLQHVLTPARLAASFSGITDASLQKFLMASDAGAANIARVLGLLLVMFGSYKNHRAFALTGAFLTALSFALMGHTATHTDRAVLATLLIVHVGIVAFWFGSLRPLLAAGNSADALDCYRAFSRAAFFLVPVILVSGAGLALDLLDSFAALLSPYGAMLAVKIVGFAILLGLASLNRWRLLPESRPGVTGATVALRRSVRVEWVLITLIIVTTITTTSFWSPGM